MATERERSITIINEIIQHPRSQKKPLRVTVTDDDEWVILTAPICEYRGSSYVPMLAGIYGISALNDMRWYDVSQNLKIRCVGFADGEDEERSIGWMKRYFAAFEMMMTPYKIFHENEFDNL
jgi:hypothetical protein